MDGRFPTSKYVLGRCKYDCNQCNWRSLTISQWHHSSYKAFCSNYGEHATNAMGYHCWNEEAIKGMKGDMSAVWDSLMVEFEVQLEQINGAIDQAFGNALQVASSIGAVQPGSVNTSQSAMRTLCRILCNRRDLTLYGFEEASEGFHSDLSSLQTNISSSIRTAFVGKLMENAYHAANMEYGRSSFLLRVFSTTL